jgi:hypothetical protein
VGLGRFELPTSRLSGVRSNQLSYRPLWGSPAHTNWEPEKLNEPHPRFNRLGPVTPLIMEVLDDAIRGVARRRAAPPAQLVVYAQQLHDDGLEPGHPGRPPECDRFVGGHVLQPRRTERE